MGIKSNNLAAIYHDFFSRSGTDAAKPYVPFSPVYAEDVFSSYVYTATGNNETIDNGIDLLGEGGLIWTKWRSGGDYSVESNALLDTERGFTKLLKSDSNAKQSNVSSYFTPASNGYEITTSSSLVNHTSGGKYCSWTFRKAPGFFDIVTWSGDSNPGRKISHSLGSTPGMIIIKNLTNTNGADWAVWHRSAGQYEGKLNTDDYFGYAYVTSVSSTDFTLTYGGNETNYTGNDYVAYVFAHDDQSFGEDGDESIIKCGSYTGSVNDQEVDLGFEPQWLLVKNIDVAADWFVKDNIRGLINWLKPSSDATEVTNFADTPEFNSTGFTVYGNSGTNFSNSSANTYVYVAIRRPHKTPTVATDVFAVNTESNDNNYSTTGFPVDAAISCNLDGSATHTSLFGARLMGDNIVKTGLTANQSAALTHETAYAFMDKFRYAFWGTNTNGFVNYAFKRAPGFFDVVAYAGTDVARTQTHNLGVAPELIIVKARDASTGWYTYAEPLGNSSYLRFDASEGANTGVAAWNNTSPTSTVFSLAGWGYNNNHDGVNYIAYLFASLSGVSKIGTYSGSNDSVDVDCGFASGARFVLIKRTDGPAVSGNGDWYIWDSTRGIGSGNDPYFLLNDGAAQVTNTDYLEQLNSGFTVKSSAPININTDGGTYLFLAIA